MGITKCNEVLYRQWKDLELNSRNYNVPDMYEDSLLSVYLRKSNLSVPWRSTSGNTNVWMGGRCERRRCQISTLWQPEVDFADWNSFEAEWMRGQGLTAGCSAVGAMEWQVLLFNTNPQISINPLRLRISPRFFPNCKILEIIFYIPILCTKKQPDSWKCNGPTDV